MPHSTRSRSSTQSSAMSTRDGRDRQSRDTHSTQSTHSSHSSHSTQSSARTPSKTTPASSRFKSSERSTTSSRSSRSTQAKEDLSPATKCWPRDSVDTYASTSASEEDLADDPNGSIEVDYQDIPPLPVYTREITDTNIRPTTPRTFAELFPSMEKLSVRHDEFTSDGNMNLRVDAVASGRRRTSYQLFHLRMHDLAKREFSLRRYSRDSGREVCNSKRKFVDPASESRPTLQRSVTSAMKTLSGKPSFLRTNSAAIPTPKSPKTSKRPGSSSSWSSNGSNSSIALSEKPVGHRQQPQQATNTIKLEFTNYARVDIHRKGSQKGKRYEFDWWGHQYSWRRVASKHLDGHVSFHLLRDGQATPIAHIVPETRSPTQVRAEKEAGGWIPPCHMWIEDQDAIQAATDVADVIIATGLIALTDDCIKTTWLTPKTHRIPKPLTSRSYALDHGSPKAFFLNHVFSRRNSTDVTNHIKQQHHHQPATTATQRARRVSAY